MRLKFSSCIASIATILTFTPCTSASLRLIESKSLNPCQDNSNFTASLFNVVFTPDNRTLAFNVVGVSSIQGNVTAELQVIAYGFTAIRQPLDPCKMDLGGLCPMSTGQIKIQSNIPIGQDVVQRIPGIAYGIPDLDGLVRIYINDTDTKSAIACVEAQLSNGKTVDQKAVGWTTAVIAGLGLVASGITSGMGHSNTAAHVAANALSLFGFFQAQAFIGMTGVKLPPIVQSWTQNFQWSMGIIRVSFLQNICTWYQRSTGGKPSSVLSTLATTSVQVQKRSIDTFNDVYTRARDQVLVKRSNTGSSVAENTKLIVVRGIDRVGFRAGIEQTNIFLTGTAFFIVFCFFVGILIALFKAFCEVAVKYGWMKSDKFQDFRNGWKIVLKGILFRLVMFSDSLLRRLVLTTSTGTDRLSSNVCVMPMGNNTTRLCRRSHPCDCHISLHDRNLVLGCTKGHPVGQAVC
jgi:Transient receptor potential (TRP) ion channel/ML-like domain